MRASWLAQILPLFGLLQSVLLEPDGIDVDEASCVADYQLAKAIPNLGLGAIDSGGEVERKRGFLWIVKLLGLRTPAENRHREPLLQQRSRTSAFYLKTRG
ncbi:MAG: hypothetical protein M1840_001809 [Geoglossum simile]|nr:MAG: hypothetical protein M1840_001809 [Geoglossum simile]